jgi:hypothetical protein
VELRKCCNCGLEAYTEAELELFKKSKGYKHNRQNICKKCSNSFYRKGGKYFENTRKLITEWKRENSTRQINFKGQRKYFPNPVKQNICMKCGQKYPEELDAPTHLHHITYNSKNPLKGTVELCRPCHFGLHRYLRSLINKEVKA